MSTPLSALVALITSSVQTLESLYDKQGAQFPSLDAPLHSTPLGDDPKAQGASRIAIAAASQLIAAIRGPADTIFEYTLGMHTASSIGLAVDCDVPDILAEASPDGLQVDEIGKIAGVKPTDLARTMRHLASRHIFREVTPNVFANNRVSSILVKAKPVKELRSEELISKYDGAPPAALAGHFTDESLKSSAYLAAFVQNSEGYDTPFSLAYKTKGSVWDWFNEKGNEWRLGRFSTALKGSMGSRFSDNVFIEGYNWAALEKDSVVVDVGGNVGKVVRILQPKFPHLRYIIQDLPSLQEGYQAFWQAEGPEALAEQRVEWQAHDFFTPQPVKGAAAYIMRWILHDWEEQKSITILTHLRAAADTRSRLVIFESIMPHACPEPDGPPEPPAPLLANFGVGFGGMTTMLDLQMMAMTGGCERTREQFAEIGHKSGWAIEAVTSFGPISAIVYAPV
ncbi:S-adenosyl-L-methionine-dependent methyltransferase [Gloeopeniophorella convolvens]|nr:S-adenosyl-L-methionine-dependent methyltransferase [Gloeopeniophorella convolvens]